MNECIRSVAKAKNINEKVILDSLKEIKLSKKQIFDFIKSSQPLDVSINVEQVFPDARLLEKVGASQSSAFIATFDSKHLEHAIERMKSNYALVSRDYSPNIFKHINMEALAAEFENKEVFIKVGIDTSNDNSLYQELYAYNFINDHIIGPGRSPNFVKFLFGFTTQHTADLGNLWKNISASYPKRPKRINVVVTEKIEGKTLTGEIYSDVKLINETNKHFYIRKYREIMFQVLYSLRELNSLGLKHNDIHLSNIFVEPHPTALVYEPTEGIYYQTYSPKVKIFDYDLSSFKGDLMVNTKLDGTMCPQYGLCRNKNDKFDMFIVIFFMYRYLANYLPEFAEEIHQTFILDEFWQVRDIEGYETNPDIPFMYEGRMCKKVDDECSPDLVVGDDQIMTFTNSLVLTNFFDSLRMTKKPPVSQIWRSIFTEIRRD